MGSVTIDGVLVSETSNEGCSNKAKTMVISTQTMKFQSKSLPQCSSPFIDRLSVVVNVHDQVLQSDLRGSHWWAAEDPADYVPAKASKGFKKAFRLKLPSVVNSKHWPHYQFASDDDGVTKLRIDFVPVDLGSEGMIELNAWLSTLVPDGWSFFIKHGRITRIDIATDVYGLTMADFLIIPPQCLTVKHFESDGLLQTVELGKPKSNQTSIYDRHKKRIAKGQGNKFGPCVRIERKLRMPNLQLSELPMLENPFGKLFLVSPKLTQPAAEISASKWMRFCCTVAKIGLENALGSLAKKRRTAYRKHLKTLGTGWWNPEQIWSQWPKALDQSLVSDPKAFP